MDDRALALRAGFEAMGAQVVDPPILQPAETLLDLYGEDIRARAYVTSDALRGEQMLRPDFTVPVVEMHMAHGAEPARYTYAGLVFRRQENDPGRASEYIQVGYEIFDRTDPAAADAEVFAALAAAVQHVPAAPHTGDIGLLTAAVSGLEASDARKAALLRHIWRPDRFRRLLDRFSGAAPRGPVADLSDAPQVGKRSQAEVQARLETLHKDTQDPPTNTEFLHRLLDVAGPMPAAIDDLHHLSQEAPAIAPAVTRLTQRATALEARGIDVSSLPFATQFGRTSMEYYDGFVFAFTAEGHPPVASGGRYDALTQRLGKGVEIPAVGGVVRPGVMAAMGCAS